MLEVSKITAGYGGNRILNEVSFVVPERGIVALLGGNGTGKSTTLKVVAGLVKPASGEVTFLGERIDHLPAKAMSALGLCLVPQGKEAFTAMSVEENLLMGAYHRRRDRAGIASDLASVYERFPRLADRRRSAAGLLSGGERQMLSVGRALMSRPKLVLLDEPSAALAPKVVGEVALIIASLRDLGLSILLVEQNVSLALEVADEINVLREGRIVFSKPNDKNLDMSSVRDLYLGA
jgi:branched-chain amino acid transport system ATP-binding protein